MNDTIFAAATAPGRAAVAVVRVSGPLAADAVRALARRRPPARSARVRMLRTPEGEALDQALVLWMPGPGSYTGEDCAEFHVHGGVAVVERLHAALADLGLRLAEPGEFTRRAFETGKLDLAQAEGVADLVDAETEAQRRQALSQVAGALSRAQSGWREGLLAALAVFEAAVDFPDEDVPRDVAERARPVLERLIGELEAAGADAARGERVRAGYRIALLGAPNAGKSTLLNALAGREAAIVNARPGTTRDVIEVPVVLAGYKALLADTAGLREAVDEIEAEGVRRARNWAAGADLRLWLVDGALATEAHPPAELQAGDLCVLTKQDMGEGGATDSAQAAAAAAGLAVLAMSARVPEDVAVLREMLQTRVSAALAGSETPTATRLRHRAHLSEAVERLRHALQSTQVELAAEDVRLAGRALDRITGRLDPEAVLERIFATFCIGK
ncbi:tRNA uridine-5-carboxymethylaminomethyl(34) synthesis GTPase MnmE [Phenylobacterium sp.]|jgi:tRNA modification GTPase|uniref:tRNA uridine-5-carboxymethylaminomethyl(34) synthesis GTPase MnmE n=1 Tax=Phenylobacterium sp. TaxID=1871053 RepID=UPI002F3EADC6